MAKDFSQKFDPFIRIYTAAGRQEIKERIWSTSPNLLIDKSIQHMGYIGSYQLEEVWKRYNNRVYISNYGYVALFDTDDDKAKAQRALGSVGAWIEMNSEAKNLIYKHIKIPDNKHSNGCKVWLYINGKDGGSVHVMVAEKFLKKPDGWRPDWQVHHIDSNSYNNSVTNLIWLPPETHKGFNHGNHGIFHPMSYKGEVNLKCEE